jgi:hypothetical protein
VTTGLHIVVKGRWVSMDYLLGDVQMVHNWPGGSEELSWVPGGNPALRHIGGEQVVAYLGPLPVWAGTMTEPDPSQERQVAAGAYRDLESYAALTAGGAVTTVPDTAIDAAIANYAMPLTRLGSISASAVDLDVSQGPVMLDQLLNAWSTQSGSRWGVNAKRQIFAKADDTTPTYMTLPLDGGLGFAMDNYASTLIGRYYNGTTYATATRSNTSADTLRRRQAIVDLTPRGTLTSTKANTILDNLLALGRAVPQWTTGISLSYGEILSTNAVPTMLERVNGQGRLLRIPGGYELAQRLNGALYVDIPIGRTTLAGGLLTVEPRDVIVGTLADAITAAVTNS